jgi:hypothetical protein
MVISIKTHSIKPPKSEALATKKFTAVPPNPFKRTSHLAYYPG